MSTRAIRAPSAPRCRGTSSAGRTDNCAFGAVRAAVSGTTPARGPALFFVRVEGFVPLFRGGVLRPSYTDGHSEHLCAGGITVENPTEGAARNASDNDLLYHYTSTESFLKIIDSGELWASHVRYQNDTSEQLLIWDMARARLRKRLENKTDDKRDRLLKFQSLAYSPVPMDIYILCFSMDGGDRLSQWRGYGSQAGISIGFYKNELKSKCRSFTRVASQKGGKPMGFCFLKDIRYISPNGDEKAEKIIDLFIDNENPTEVEKGYSVEEVFNRRVALSSGYLKHQAFTEEKEYRIVMFDIPDDMVQLRSYKSMIVPYVPYDLGKGTAEWPIIQRIIVGPSPHQDETVAAIKKKIDSRVRVEKSSIPYRNW